MTGPIPHRVALRAASRFTEDGSGCFISTYSVASHGYAQIGWNDDRKAYVTTAHRAAWVASTGEQVPDGLTVDHICRVRRCVNPAHLRLLTNVENASDNGQVRVNLPTGSIWACGHEAVRSPSGKLYCRECIARKKRERRRRARSTT